MCKADYRPPRNWREWFSKLTNFLTVERMQDLWDRKKTNIYAYGANPFSNGEIRENPGEKLDKTIDVLLESKGDGPRLALWVLNHVCDLTNHESLPKKVFLPDKSSWEMELFDDEGPWFNYRKACRDYRAGLVDPEIVNQYEQELIRELRETTVKVLMP